MRYVVIGCKGFIGKQLFKDMKNLSMDIIGLSRQEVDLNNIQELEKFKTKFRDGDNIIFTAANAPVKNEKMFSENIIMIKNFLLCFKDFPLGKILYVSSDAVYSDTREYINENSETKPDSLHGIMHLTRENMLASYFKEKLIIVRPTLIYGYLDPHNGYGPNNFIRSAFSSKKISLFGKGEELRDHIDIRLVSNLIIKIISYKKNGIYNLVSGKPMTFCDITDEIKIFFKENYDEHINILSKPRTGPMPHGGFRCFENNKIRKLLKDNNLIDFKKNLKYHFENYNLNNV